MISHCDDRNHGHGHERHRKDTVEIGETKKACELSARRSSARFNVLRSFNDLETADRGPHTFSEDES